MASGFLLLVCAIALLAASARASSPSGFGPGSAHSLPVPSAFRLQASNGYSLVVLASPELEGTSKIFMFVFRKHEKVSYSIPATVTETSIQANLGALGEISLTFQRSGRAARAKCGRDTIAFDSGHYEGKIAFHGEEGYTDVEATTVPGDPDLLARFFCGGGFVSGSFGSSRARGAELYLRNPGLGPQLSVSKKKPGAAARILASDSEYTNGISIDRVTGLWIPPGRFTYDRRLRAATLHPPAPFAGTGHFDLGKKAGQRWSGDLTVDLPGRADTPLVAPTLRAFLVPYE